jgi:hypothetical protein
MSPINWIVPWELFDKLPKTPTTPTGNGVSPCKHNVLRETKWVRFPSPAYREIPYFQGFEPDLGDFFMGISKNDFYTFTGSFYTQNSHGSHGDLIILFFELVF